MKNSDKPTCGDYGGYSKSTEQPCERVAGWGTPGETGRCRRHKGTNADGSSHEGNQFAVTHGAYADPKKLYSEVFDDRECELVDRIFDDYYTLYTHKHGHEPTEGERLRLFKIAVNAVTELRVENWFVDQPDALNTGTPFISRETHVSESGETYHRYKPSPSLKAIANLEGYNRRWLDKLGLLPDDAALSGEASKDLAVWIAEKLAGN